MTAEKKRRNVAPEVARARGGRVRGGMGMRRWRVLTHNYGEAFVEAGRFFTQAGAERWALAHQERMLQVWKVAKR